MKALRYILPSLIIVAVIGLLCYQYFVSGDLESSDITKGILVIAGAIFSMVRPRKARVVNKKTVYQKAYSEFIDNAFHNDPKLERKFYDAIHDYNQNKPSAAIAKLKKLRGECMNTGDIRAVTVFMALCYDDMQLYEEAITHYDAALRMRDSSTLHSNKGLCYQRLGSFAEAEEAYCRAIQSDPKNAFAYNNLSVLYFRRGEYDDALHYAQEAIAVDPKMKQALSTAAICCALMGDDAHYQDYYRRAVSAGYDGQKIKTTIRKLNPNI